MQLIDEAASFVEFASSVLEQEAKKLPQHITSLFG
jgi:hypothetical protein